MPADSLTIAIVTYHPDPEPFVAVLRQLRVAQTVLRNDAGIASTLVILDNGGQHAQILALVRQAGLGGQPEVQVRDTGGNPGYGRAHNQAIVAAATPYHLILNPDVLVADDALLRGVRWLQQHPEVAAISPAAVDAEGQPAYLCKRYPALVDLLLRGFAPRGLQRRFQARLDRYKYRAVIDAGEPAEVDLISGCFMLCRGGALRAVGGFDPRYFLYFEDFSLSLALRAQGSLQYLPTCRIRHFGGDAGRKGWRHVLYFLRSALRFYGQHGWKWI